MAEPLTRYDQVESGDNMGGMQIRPDGRWVRYSEAQATIAALEARLAVLESGLSTIDSLAQFQSSVFGIWCSETARATLRGEPTCEAGGQGASGSSVGPATAKGADQSSPSSTGGHSDSQSSASGSGTTGRTEPPAVDSRDEALRPALPPPTTRGVTMAIDDGGPVQFGKVVRVHVLAMFKCERCGDECLRLTSAPIAGSRIAETAPAPPGEIVCNECTKKDRAKERKRAEVARQQRAWQRKKAKP